MASRHLGVFGAAAPTAVEGTGPASGRPAEMYGAPREIAHKRKSRRRGVWARNCARRGGIGTSQAPRSRLLLTRPRAGCADGREGSAALAPMKHVRGEGDKPSAKAAIKKAVAGIENEK